MEEGIVNVERRTIMSFISQKYIVLVLCGIMLSSCSKPEINEINEDTEKLTSTEVVVSLDEKLLTSTNDYDYILDTDIYEEGKISIKYPQIKDMQHSNMQNAVNGILKSKALKLVDEVKDDEVVTVFEIDYKVKFNNEKLLSVQFVGYINANGSPHPTTFSYTSNIDIANGVELQLADIIYLDNLIEQYHNGKLDFMKSFQSEAFEELSDEELLDKFKDAELYFTEDSLGISVNIPHAVGDYSELEIKYDNLDDSIMKYENWRELVEK